MKYKEELLCLDERVIKKIEYACIFNNVKYQIFNGTIFNIENTNVSFIDSCKIVIKINNFDLLILIYDNSNYYLYNRFSPISISELKKILNILVKKNNNNIV